MLIGCHVPTTIPAEVARDAVLTFAREAEAREFASLWVSDHVVIPRDTAGYPAGGRFPIPPDVPYLEPVAMLGALAVVTQRARIGCSVFILGHRHAVAMAKMLATIDVLSGGRLTVGIGAGWLKTEFDAVVTTPFAERGAVTDEYVAAFRTLWTADKPKIDGRYVHYDGLVLAPKPVQRPHPPIWVGGESGPSLRRTARFGDAWYPIGSNNAHLLDTLPRYQAGIARLRQLTEAAGRHPNAVALTYRVKRYGDAVPPVATDGNRRLFSGNDSDLVADIRALRELGVTAIDFDFERPAADDVVAEMRSFRERVLARV
jgi:probable F420-dependent oxidoreductase